MTKLTIRLGYSRTVLYFRDVSGLNYALDLIFSDLSLENMHDPFIAEITQVK